VREVFEREQGKQLSDFVLTTNHILSETLTMLRVCGKRDDRFRHARAVRLGQQLYQGPSTRTRNTALSTA
jgi:hypothetical protein